MATPTFSRFVYCDTNILSYLATRREVWPRLAAYLFDHDLTLSIGSQIAELSDAERLHEALSLMLTSVPAALIKPWDAVLQEEVDAHPSTRSRTLLMYPLNALLLQPDGPQQLCDHLSCANLRAARESQRRSAQLVPARFAQVSSHFPPSPSGKYARQQASEFAWLIVVQSLAKDHPQFLRGFKSDVTDFNVQSFRSIRLSALVVFYKYYLGGRAPRRLSDLGDLSHLYAIPYCHLSIMERDLANVLRQIKRHDDILHTTEVYDIDFFKTWPTPGPS